MDTFEVISKRTSLKGHLSKRPIESDKIDKILNAAMLAPSARNMQPWRFIVVEDQETINNLASKSFSETNLMLKDAPVIIITCADPGDDVVINGKEYYLFDAGLAVENMLLAATDLGLVTHPIAGVKEEELKKILDIPPSVRFIVATPIAYPAENSYDEAARERLSQRTRKGRPELVYKDKWGETF